MGGRVGCVVSVGKVCRGGGTEQQERVGDDGGFGLGFGLDTHKPGKPGPSNSSTEVHTHGHENIE